MYFGFHAVLSLTGCKLHNVPSLQSCLFSPCKSNKQTAEMVRRIGEELDEANKNAKEKRTLHEACLSQVSSLERSIKDHVRERGGKLAALDRKIKSIKGQMQSSSKDLQGHENEKQRLIMEKDAMIQERAALESQLNSVEAQIKAFEEEISKLEDKVRSIKQEYHSAKSELDFGHSKIKECDAQINSLTKKQQKLQQKLSDANVDKKKIENEMDATLKEDMQHVQQVEGLIAELNGINESLSHHDLHHQQRAL